jgi:hypothetical protein
MTRLAAGGESRQDSHERTDETVAPSRDDPCPGELADVSVPTPGVSRAVATTVNDASNQI